MRPSVWQQPVRKRKRPLGKLSKFPSIEKGNISLRKGGFVGVILEKIQVLVYNK